jgi:protein gp37
VAARLNVAPRLKDQVCEFTAFASAEPIIGPTDRLDFTGIDWVLTGGESGLGARRMEYPLLEATNDECLSAARALHFKQYGKAQNNPIVQRIMATEGLRAWPLSNTDIRIVTMGGRIETGGRIELGPRIPCCNQG